MPTALMTLYGISTWKPDPSGPNQPGGQAKHELHLGVEFEGLPLYVRVPPNSPLEYQLSPLGLALYHGLKSVRGMQIYLPDYLRATNGMLGVFPLTKFVDDGFLPSLNRLMGQLAAALGRSNLAPGHSIGYKVWDETHLAQPGIDVTRWPTAPKNPTMCW